jgi:hypothetical protein
MTGLVQACLEATARDRGFPARLRFFETTLNSQPRASASLVSMSAVGFCPLAVNKRRSVSGAAPILRARSALLMFESMRAASNARMILSVASICARASRNGLSKDGSFRSSAKRRSNAVCLRPALTRQP